MLLTLAMALFVQDDIAAKLLTGGRFAALGNRLLAVAMPMATAGVAEAASGKSTKISGPNLTPAARRDRPR